MNGSPMEVPDRLEARQSGRANCTPAQRFEERDGGRERVGRYYLHDVIGTGGMATVHAGWMVDGSRVVAIKRLRADLARRPDFVAMFADEARIALRIADRNVVRAIEVVEAGGESFLVMEYVSGASLSHLTHRASARGESVPAPVAASIAIDALRGLHATHEARDEDGRALEIVHRDVSPQNVIVGADGVSRLIDFGVAEAAGALRVNRAGELRGKIHYMAPEQLSYDGVISRRTDLYAAAVVLWEALCGRRLFKDELKADASPAATSVNRACVDALVRRYAHIPAPSTLARGVSPELDAIIHRALEPAPSKRFATAAAMAASIAGSGRVASEDEVGAWVRSREDGELAARERLVEEIERSSGVVRVTRPAREEAPRSGAYGRCAPRRLSGVRARARAEGPAREWLNERR